MANFFDFSSDQINVFMMLIDRSGSMSDHENNVIKGLRMFKKNFEGFPEVNSIAISKSLFASNLSLADFRPISEFNTSYGTGGGTALHYSICKSAKYLQEYMNRVANNTGCSPRGTFIVFSDGVPCDDPGNAEESKEIISKLNYAGVTTVFIAFGEAISSEFGKNLGFMSTIDVKNASELTNFLGVELSKSCKEQSRSLRALGANFFSGAAGTSSSAGYSATTAQALEDDDWMDDI